MSEGSRTSLMAEIEVQAKQYNSVKERYISMAQQMNSATLASEKASMNAEAITVGTETMRSLGQLWFVEDSTELEKEKKELAANKLAEAARLKPYIEKFKVRMEEEENKLKTLLSKYQAVQPK